MKLVKEPSQKLAGLGLPTNVISLLGCRTDGLDEHMGIHRRFEPLVRPHLAYELAETLGQTGMSRWVGADWLGGGRLAIVSLALLLGTVAGAIDDAAANTRSSTATQPQEVIPQGTNMRQGLDRGIDIIRLVEIVQPNKTGEVPPPEQIPSQRRVAVESPDVGLGVRRVEGGANVRQRWVRDDVFVGEAVEGATGEMDVDGVAGIDAVGVGGGRPSAATEELAADQTTVHVRPGFQGDGARGFEVKVEEGTVDGVQVGTGLGFGSTATGGPTHA
mmetsp:Transcript_24068/g.56550  ORF Transcript_24068/g.56550 Transcript_24068/m.56550 type:complete len:274 (+) Transcript_24068:1015-1836(+)